ncbi:hypothetical protein ACWDZ4_20030 [Streptomyces sp. NPDC003016]
MPEPANPDARNDALTLSPDEVAYYHRVGRNEEVDPENPHLKRLISLGLVLKDIWVPGRYIQANLREAEARLRQQAEAGASAYLKRMAAIPSLLALLEREQRHQIPDSTRDVFLPGIELANDAIIRAMDAVKYETLTAQPGLRKASTLARSIRRDTEFLKRGAAMKILYPTSARSNEPLREYVTAVTALGAQVRTIPETFSRLMIFDDKHAFFEDGGVIQSPELGGVVAEPREGAWHIQHPGMISYEREQYRQKWERGTPWRGNEAENKTAVTTPLQRSILWELEAGRDQTRIAAHLHVSLKTVNRAVNELRETLGFKTPYQLGAWWMLATEERLLDHHPNTEKR